MSASSAFTALPSPRAKWWLRPSGSSWTRRAESGTRGSSGFQAGLLYMRTGNQALAPVLDAYPPASTYASLAARRKTSKRKRKLLTMTDRLQGGSSRLRGNGQEPLVRLLSYGPERSLLSRREHSCILPPAFGSLCHYPITSLVTVARATRNFGRNR